MINATNMPVNSNEFYSIIFKLNCIKKSSTKITERARQNAFWVMKDFRIDKHAFLIMKATKGKKTKKETFLRVPTVKQFNIKSKTFLPARYSALHCFLLLGGKRVMLRQSAVLLWLRHSDVLRPQVAK